MLLPGDARPRAAWAMYKSRDPDRTSRSRIWLLTFLGDGTVKTTVLKNISNVDTYYTTRQLGRGDAPDPESWIHA